MKFKMEIIARNIVNPEAITDFISKVSKDQSDKIKIWCNTILKNYLKNEYDNLKEVTKSKKTDPEWLQEAIKRKDAQEIVIKKDFERVLIEHIFHYFDTLQGNIRHSFPEAEKATKEWDERKSKFNIKLTKGVKEVLKCENNFTWFEIIDEETLFNEGEIIQNCLRKEQHGPEYWEEVKDKKIKIFTLRDSKGIGHVAVEYAISENKIYQMLGKQNDDPIKIYHPSCLDFIKFLKCKIDKSITKFLNIITDDGNIYDIYNLPDTLEIKGSLLLNDFPLLKKLPTKSLKVGKDLNLSETNIQKLPNILIVGGYVELNDTHINKLSKNLEIGGYLNLSYTQIKELPDNLTINGWLSLKQSKIIKLPKNLKVYGNLNINNTSIKDLPSDLKVTGDLYICDTKIKKLPENLHVETLEIFATKIMEIPDSLIAKKIYVDKDKMFTLKYNKKFKNIIKWV